MTTTLVIGQPAPDFELVNHHGEKVTLSSFQGKQNVVLVFYPFAFSGTCTGELCALRDDISAFQNENVQVLGIACDPMYSARAFAEAEGYTFPILADFWPHGAVGKAYGIFNDERGMDKRAAYVIDAQGVIRYAKVYPQGTIPTSEELLAELRKL
jgi:peroxiredoxin